MKSKLYAEFRIYFPENSNQDNLNVACEALQETLFSLFDDEENPVPQPIDITYEIIREVEEEEMSTK